jgi:hypothetical protein
MDGMTERFVDPAIYQRWLRARDEVRGPVRCHTANHWTRICARLATDFHLRSRLTHDRCLRTGQIFSLKAYLVITGGR